MNSNLDCAKVIKHFGGLAKTARLMRENGASVTVGTVEKWRRRSSIPTSHLITLAVIAKAKKMRFNLYDFISENKNDS